ncbi:MAG: VWA domain-containing protein [Pirellulales bacterium]|nr:VWA domain-containing protein [Pirellulales bacterium]
MNLFASVRRALLPLVAMAIATGTPGAASAEEPADKPAEHKAAPQEGLDGLGFSVAPKEGGKARTEFFGVVGEGYKFVFVIDRSASMGGDGANALQAVKAELSECLKNLDSVHQFQFIFYNQRPALFNPAGRPGRLAFATEENKRHAERFIGSITASGGTNHEDALRMALGMRPDVIFFLTDADEPTLETKQLEKIVRMAAGIVVNAVEFGPGPKPAGSSFLAELARRSGGGYAYVDLSKSTAEKK